MFKEIHKLMKLLLLISMFLITSCIAYIDRGTDRKDNQDYIDRRKSKLVELYEINEEFYRNHGRYMTYREYLKNYYDDYYAKSLDYFVDDNEFISDEIESTKAENLNPQKYLLYFTASKTIINFVCFLDFENVCGRAGFSYIYIYNPYTKEWTKSKKMKSGRPQVMREYLNNYFDRIESKK